MASIVSESCSSSIFFAHPNGSHLRWKILLTSRTWHDKQGKIAVRKTESKEHTAHETTTPRQKSSDFSIIRQGQTAYFARYSMRSPLAAAGSSAILQTPSGGLYCSCLRCFGVYSDVCLK